MFRPNPSAIGIAPLNSIIGTILINQTNKYFTIIGKLDMFFCPFFIFYLNFLYCTIKGVNCLEENCLSLCIFLKVFKYLA